jgi:hypothetical protein
MTLGAVQWHRLKPVPPEAASHGIAILKLQIATHHVGNSQMAMTLDLICGPVVLAGGHVAIGYDESGKIRF